MSMDRFVAVNPGLFDGNLADLKAMAAEYGQTGYFSNAVPDDMVIYGVRPDEEMVFDCPEHGRQYVKPMPMEEMVRRAVRTYSGLYRPPINPYRFGQP